MLILLILSNDLTERYNDYDVASMNIDQYTPLPSRVRIEPNQNRSLPEQAELHQEELQNETVDEYIIEFVCFF